MQNHGVNIFDMDNLKPKAKQHTENEMNLFEDINQIYNAGFSNTNQKFQKGQNKFDQDKHNKLSQQLDDLSQLGKDLSKLKKQSIRSKNQLNKIKKLKFKKGDEKM